MTKSATDHEDGERSTSPSRTSRRSAPTGRTGRCKRCRRVLPAQTMGRPREFCSQACRQWHWVNQQRAGELHLSEQERIVLSSELDVLHDELYVLACAVGDTERDLAALGAHATAANLREMLDWLLEAARPLRDRELQRP
jgi:hypothetical protein